MTDVIHRPGYRPRIDPDRVEKRCSKCGETKPRSGFHKNRAQPDGLANYCKPCARANEKQWRDRGGHLMGRYGLTPEMYREMFERQEGLCALCELRPIAHIDHDHETGRVRGLLCQECNTGLGKLGDSADALRRALAYVEGGT